MKGTRVIRPVDERELSVLQDIERAAGLPFAEIGMDMVAADEPASVATLREFQRAGRAWVRVDDRDIPVAYLIAAVVDGAAHIEQVSVRPEYAGRRIGKALIDHAVRWARGVGLHTVTLTTFTEVGWNGPYYRRIGFRYLSADEVTPHLREIREAEREHGLDRWPRAAMVAEIEDWIFD